ncbi:hypothetical protein, partial [Klebsiella quasipneumoniae]|uniref:hypothetical protein n=1 Tax=Klebsiella quasipneumoniae TaxID=1463165 RepID=UPI00272F6305
EVIGLVPERTHPDEMDDVPKLVPPPSDFYGEYLHVDNLSINQAFVLKLPSNRPKRSDLKPR